jgi:UDP-3-O-[3-hydroxymyristoyl] glucosamine N-acyltransferase
MPTDKTITIQELAALVGGQLSFADKDCPSISGVASIAEAAGDEVTFLGNAKYLPALRQCRAAAVLVPEDFAEEVPPVLVRVANPSLAFARLVEFFAPPAPVFAPGVHPTAVLGEGVRLGEGVSIQAYAVLEAGAVVGAGSVIGAHGYVGHHSTIGENCFLHPRVTVASRCVVGNRVILHSGVVLGSDGFGFEWNGGKHVKIPQVGIVQVDDDVEIGANTTVDRARFGRTWIQAGCKIDNLVQVAHNVVVGKHTLLVAQAGISGSTRLGERVTLAGQVGVAGHLHIGDGAVVTAQSGVSKSLPGAALYMGSPAQPAAEFREQVALVRRLGRLQDRVQRLEAADGQEKGTDSKPKSV